MTLKSKHIILVFAFVVFASCSSNEMDNMVEKTASEIVLSTSVEQMSARGATNLLETNLSLNNRVAVYINELTALTPSVTYTQPLQYRVSNSSGDLSPVSGITPYYPMNGNYVEIYAFYPYAAAIATGGNFTMSTKQVDKVDYEASDLMSANLIGRDESNALTLSFRHLGSKITYHLTTSQDNVKLISSKVKVTNVKLSANLNPSAGQIVSVLGGESSEILISNDGSKDGSGVIFPQTIPANTRFIEIELLTKEKVYGVMPTAYTFQAGKAYVFNIDVKVDRDPSVLVLNDIQIVDWVDETPQDIEGERTN